MSGRTTGPGYYAYLCRDDGSEPMGTENKIISRDHRTFAGFRRFVLRHAKPGVWKFFRFQQFYDETTFRLFETITVKGDANAAAKG